MKIHYKQAIHKAGIICLFSLFLFPGLSNAQIVSQAHGVRESMYDVNFYFLDLDIERASGVISGNAMTTATSLVNNLDTFALELASTLTIDSVQAALNGGSFQHANFTHAGFEVNVLLPFTANVNQSVQARVYYHGSPVVADGICGNFDSGFFEQSACGSGDNGTHKFSACPPYNASSWWPCKQWLTDKADSSWFYITTNTGDYAASNGLLADTINAGGKTTWQWRSKYPVEFYLISFVVTKYQPTFSYWHPAGRNDSLQLTYYGYAPTDVTNVLNLYSTLFGLYPFYDEKLGIANVDLGGGIENQTMIALGAAYGGFDPHEMAHQWFGDHVTCGSWKDVMLNEGFARWCESIYAEFNSSNPDSARMTHFSDNLSLTPVYGVNMDTTTVEGVFGNQTVYYNKAAMVINALRFTIGSDSVFFLGLRNYQTQFGGKSALATDLKAVMENTSGIDLTDFFNQWYYHAGGPTFNIRWAQITNLLTLQIQETTNTVTNPLFKTPVEIKIQRTQGDTTVRLMIVDTLTTFKFNCPGSITGFVVDPNQWIPNGTGTVTNDTTLGVLSFNKSDDEFSIFPNPSSGSFVIKGGNVIDIKIYNALGMLEYSKEHYKQGENMDVKNLKEGIHFVHITDLKKEEVFKLLIEK